VAEEATSAQSPLAMLRPDFLQLRSSGTPEGMDMVFYLLQLQDEFLN
jgi:hypothetical protein